MKVFFIVEGPLIWLDEAGESDGYFDVHNYIAMCKARHEKIGIGAAFVETLFRRRFR
jgi:2,4'-dihydroxyacetophenone dioxygenase